MECDSVCGLWLTRAGNNDEKNAGRDDNVGEILARSFQIRLT